MSEYTQAAIQKFEKAKTDAATETRRIRSTPAYRSPEAHQNQIEPGAFQSIIEEICQAGKELAERIEHLEK
jgi:hypothetical protein